jgi:hypothetical protein
MLISADLMEICRPSGDKLPSEARAGKNSFPPDPLPFCPIERSVWRVPAHRSFGAGGKRAVSFVQNRFGFRQTNAPELNFQEFCRFIQLPIFDFILQNTPQENMTLSLFIHPMRGYIRNLFTKIIKIRYHNSRDNYSKR